MSSSTSFRALYYPYARCTNETTLKRAILLFDEVWFIDPTSPKMREGLITDYREVPIPIIEDWHILRDTYGPLLEKGIVKLFDPSQLIKENDKLLSKSLKADIEDNEVWKLCSSPDQPDTWSILRRKIPPSTFKFLQPQATTRVYHLVDTLKDRRKKEYEEYMNGPKRRGGTLWSREEAAEARRRGLTVKDLRQELWDYHDPRTDSGDSRYDFFDGKVYDQPWDTRKDIQRDAWGINDKKSKSFEYSCILPFATGSSLVLNQALLVADELGLIPFTDSVLHHQLIGLKYQRSLKNLSTYKKPIISGIRPLNPEKLRRVALTLFDTIIPEQALRKISISEAIKFRESSTAAFGRLKLYIAELTAQIESEVWDDKFEKDIQTIVHQKIAPEALKAHDNAVEIYEKLFGKLAKKVMASLTPTVGASIFAGLTFPAILLMGSASVLGSILPDLIDSYLEVRSVKRSSLSYLIDLRKGK